MFIEIFLAVVRHTVCMCGACDACACSVCRTHALRTDCGAFVSFSIWNLRVLLPQNWPLRAAQWRWLQA